MTMAGDPKHLGVRIGLTAALHTWDRRSLIIRTPIS
jgi:hypothetical protein